MLFTFHICRAYKPWKAEEGSARQQSIAMTYIDLIGYIAAFLTSTSFLPQALMVIKTRNTKALSLTMYSMFTFGVTLWLIYGYISHDWPIIISNSITLIFAAIILSIIISNMLNERKALTIGGAA